MENDQSWRADMIRQCPHLQAIGLLASNEVLNVVADEQKRQEGIQDDLDNPVTQAEHAAADAAEAVRIIQEAAALFTNDGRNPNFDAILNIVRSSPDTKTDKEALPQATAEPQKSPQKTTIFPVAATSDKIQPKLETPKLSPVSELAATQTAITAVADTDKFPTADSTSLEPSPIDTIYSLALPAKNNEVIQRQTDRLAVPEKANPVETAMLAEQQQWPEALPPEFGMWPRDEVVAVAGIEADADIRLETVAVTNEAETTAITFDKQENVAIEPATLGQPESQPLITVNEIEQRQDDSAILEAQLVGSNVGAASVDLEYFAEGQPSLAHAETHEEDLSEIDLQILRDFQKQLREATAEDFAVADENDENTARVEELSELSEAPLLAVEAEQPVTTHENVIEKVETIIGQMAALEPEAAAETHTMLAEVSQNLEVMMRLMEITMDFDDGTLVNTEDLATATEHGAHKLEKIGVEDVPVSSLEHGVMAVAEVEVETGTEGVIKAEVEVEALQEAEVTLRQSLQALCKHIGLNYSEHEIGQFMDQLLGRHKMDIDLNAKVSNNTNGAEMNQINLNNDMHETLSWFLTTIKQLKRQAKRTHASYIGRRLMTSLASFTDSLNLPQTAQLV